MDVPFMVYDSVCDVDAEEFGGEDYSQSYDILPQSNNVSHYIDEDSSFQFEHFEFY